VRELETELARLKGMRAKQAKRGARAAETPAGNEFSGGGKSTVREHYEALPYPPRPPDHDAQYWMQPFGFNLPSLSAKLFGGRLLERCGPGGRKPLRILVAGCGTGDMAIGVFRSLDTWAAQLPKAQLVALDLSSASLEVTKTRIAKLRANGIGCNLDVRFVRGSLLEVSAMAAELGGQFDLIECAGVLHHLPDPAAGLASLASVLEPDGAMVLMVYAQYGRAGIYHMQLIGQLLAEVSNVVPLMSETSRRLSRHLLASMHAKHPTVRESSGNWSAEDDSVLVDTFLHTQDRAYTVLQLRDDLCAPARMRVAGFAEPSLYDPSSYFSMKSPGASFEPQPFASNVAEAISRMGMLEKSALAEAIATSIRKHQFYAVRAEHTLPPVASLEDELTVPLLLTLCAPHFAAEVFVPNPGETSQLGFDFPVYGPLVGLFRVSPPAWILPPITQELIKLVDGERTTKEIIDTLEYLTSDVIVSSPGQSRRASIKAQLVGLFGGLVEMNVLAVGYDRWPHAAHTQYLELYPLAKPSADECAVGFWR
jgi:SAM-dependent methyltransferase